MSRQVCRQFAVCAGPEYYLFAQAFRQGIRYHSSHFADSDNANAITVTGATARGYCNNAGNHSTTRGHTETTPITAIKLR